MTYHIIVDRYSNWPLVERTKFGADGLTNCTRRSFATYGIPDEISTDGGPEYIATATRLSAWGIDHRFSSVAFPHSNCRTELGMKTIKRLFTDNTDNKGDLNTDAFQRAIFQYRNSPTRTQNYLRLHAYLDDLSKTSSPYCVVDTDSTIPGARPSPLERKP